MGILLTLSRLITFSVEELNTGNYNNPDCKEETKELLQAGWSTVHDYLVQTHSYKQDVNEFIMPTVDPYMLLREFQECIMDLVQTIVKTQHSIDFRLEYKYFALLLMVMRHYQVEPNWSSE